MAQSKQLVLAILLTLILSLVAKHAIWAAPTGGAPQAAAKKPTERIQVVIAPAPKTRFVHTTSVKTKTTVKRLGGKEDKTVADVFTNIIELTTGAAEFDGTLPLSIRLIDTNAQAVTQMLKPLQRQSPLSGFVGAVAELNLYPDQTLRVADIRMRGDVNMDAIKTLHKMAETVIFPFHPPKLLLAKDEHFELSEIRQFPVENEQVPFELLRKYTLLEFSDKQIKLKSDIVVRPRRREQAQQVFGRGDGFLTIDRVYGIVDRSHDNLIIEAKVLGSKGWMVTRSETESETFTVPQRIK